MQISIVIPAHNEANYLKICLNSFVAQTYQPNELIIVDDNSTDGTAMIASEYAFQHTWIKVVQRKSRDVHEPGKKVVDSFNYGLQHAAKFDLIGKFDADIELPKNYLETIVNHFQSNWKLGMCAGLLFIEKNDDWIYENIANQDHIRGPIKLYHKACFNKIGGLRPGVGWDTVDVLLAQYNGFETVTVKDLIVKHLRPTGHGYSNRNYQAKGQALYRMRYGIVLAKLAALKMAFQNRSPKLYVLAIFGYLKATLRNTPRFVSKDEGVYIRKYRWKGIFKKAK
ncbi:MAG: glycosyltransferase family 2 protein [Croceitalea sp.]|nr:glycosyltransferase family 2 protein [Croceitalea sp.]NNM18016.1 glycosyltransferase family 2 protein [Croceitalea sp.]